MTGISNCVVKTQLCWRVIFVVFQTVRAADEEGKASTASVNIEVTDVNDQNPEFQNLPYSFRVKEGEVDAFVGRVFAEDKDIGSNAELTYSLPAESQFAIDSKSGKIFVDTINIGCEGGLGSTSHVLHGKANQLQQPRFSVDDLTHFALQPPTEV